MDPNVSTQMPEGYQNKPLGTAEDLTIKLYVFGTLALVIAAGIGYGVYAVFYRKTHQAKKEVRNEQQARDMEKGILPRSRHYPIGKVPKKRNNGKPPAHPIKQHQPPELDYPTFSNPFEPNHTAPFSPSSSSSSRLQRSPRASWASDLTATLPPPPKALTSQKVRESIASR